MKIKLLSTNHLPILNILIIILLSYFSIIFNLNEKILNKNINYNFLQTNNIDKHFTFNNHILIQNNLTKLNQHCSYIPLPDTRIIALRRFLKKYKSPMYPYADLIISQADKYNQDWRIIVAISGIESKFGKILPYNSYNAWGWRGGQDGQFSNFNNWEHAITYITKAFTSGYGQNPNPYSFFKTYCPPCSNAWPNSVTKYMQELTLIRKEINKEFTN